ncbi:uncharacterized protein LOC134649793 [Cydia amplana]|uniref:uncharacterized protein LOC134649793 n=1 Tax=Cydia amplana TaxID=1869771 RepID=UPI002FE596C0
MSNAEEKAREIFNSIITEKFPDACKVKINPISSSGANYSSALYEAYIITAEGTQELFAKVASMGDHFDETSRRIFDSEKFVLTKIANVYEKLQDKHGILKRFTFPKIYNHDRDDIPIVVMENLASKGYGCYDRFKSIDWKYASKSVETLARFHALSFALQKDSPEEFKLAGDILKLPETVLTSPLWEGIADGAMAVVDEKDKEKLARVLEGAVGWSKLMDFSEPLKTSVLIHGDYRPSNLLHKEMNGEYNVIPVDYQTTRLGCPVADLLYFTLIGSDQQFRMQHYHQLVDHYYEHLALMMTKFGLNPDEEYGREEFESDIKAKLPIALAVAAIVLPFVTVEAASAPNFEREQYVPRANELFAERFRGLMHDLKQWGVLNGEYHVIPVDYQTARLGCPVSDLLYFIVMGSDQQFRRQHYHQLLDHYYQHLTLMMTKFDLQPDEVYGREEFEDDIKAKLPVALSLAATVLPFVIVNVNSAPNFGSVTTMPSAEKKVHEVLISIVKEKFPNAYDVKIKPITSDGANYTSGLYEASITTPEITLQLFVKAASMGHLIDASKHMFRAEKTVLTTVSNAFKRSQDKHAIIERFIFPKFYKSVDGIIVMENLASKGYEVYDRFKSIDWKYASKSVEALARFHALSLAFKNEYPEEFKKVAEVLEMPRAIVTYPQFEGASDGAMAAVDEEDREKLSKVLEGSEGLSKSLDLSEPRSTTVIIHGDFRQSNLMHKQVNGKYHVVPVDYQTARPGCPVADLLYFILMCSDQQFRKHHFHQLVDHYYKHLALMMKEFGLQPDEVYGREEFESDMKAKLPISLSVAAAALPFATADADSAPNFERGQCVPGVNELFVERFRELVQDFKQWGVI